MKTAEDIIRVMRKIPDNVEKTGAGSIANDIYSSGNDVYTRTMIAAVKSDMPENKSLDLDLVISGRSQSFKAITGAVEKGWNEARFRVPKPKAKSAGTKITPITTITPEGAVPTDLFNQLVEQARLQTFDIDLADPLRRNR